MLRSLGLTLDELIQHSARLSTRVEASAHVINFKRQTGIQLMITLATRKKCDLTWAIAIHTMLLSGACSPALKLFTSHHHCGTRMDHPQVLYSSIALSHMATNIMPGIQDLLRLNDAETDKHARVP